MLFLIVERVRRLFDLTADPQEIRNRFQNDVLLAARVERRPGLRVPGAWDGFELAVRAILGQQISVKGASTLAGRIALAYGRPFGDGVLFPSRESLANAPIEECGVRQERGPPQFARWRAAISHGKELGDSSAHLDRFQQIPGIGAWTAQYVAMRAFGEPDAFPAGDLVLQRAAQCRKTKELERRSESWRPWRSYAAIHLWQGMKDDTVVR